MIVASLKELFDNVCLKHKGSIEIVADFNQGGMTYSVDASYNNDSNSVDEGWYDLVLSLYYKTCDYFSDYPDDSVEWIITKEGVKVTTFGHGEWERNAGKEEDELDEEEEEDDDNVYEVSPKGFNKIYELYDFK